MASQNKKHNHASLHPFEQCRYCGKHIWRPESIERGCGPTCFQKYEQGGQTPPNPLFFMGKNIKSKRKYKKITYYFKE